MFQWMMRMLSGPSEAEADSPKNGENHDESWHDKPHNKQLKRMVDKTRAEAIEVCDRVSQERYDDIDEQIQKHRDLQLKIRAFKQKKSAANG